MEEIKKIILIVILEPQNKTSTEHNYFNGLKNSFKIDKWKNLFNDNFGNIYIESVKSWKYKNKKLIDDCKTFIKPNIVYGIIDNDNKENLKLAKKIFTKLAKEIKSCGNKYKKIILPPNNMTFEYFIALHILEQNKISLDQSKIDSNLKNYFDKDLSKIKCDEKIFEKLFKNGNDLLFKNIKKHPKCINDTTYCDNSGDCNLSCHRYAELVNLIFKQNID